MTYWQRDHAWFASFAPAEDPEIAVVVLNEHGGHGGCDAAPTATAIIKKYFELKREDANATIAASTALPTMPVRPGASAARRRGPPPVQEEVPSGAGRRAVGGPGPDRSLRGCRADAAADRAPDGAQDPLGPGGGHAGHRPARHLEPGLGVAAPAHPALGAAAAEPGGGGGGGGGRLPDGLPLHPADGLAHLRGERRGADGAQGRGPPGEGRGELVRARPAADRAGGVHEAGAGHRAGPLLPRRLPRGRAALRAGAAVEADPAHDLRGGAGAPGPRATR